MKLVRFLQAGAVCVGVRDNLTIVNLTTALTSKYGPIRSMRQFLTLGQEALNDAKVLCQSCAPEHRLNSDSVKFLAPINDSEKVICIGMNYVDHCLEQNFPIPKEPIIFSKFANSIIASGDPIMFTKEMTKLDFEVELAIVIGKPGRRISKANAMDHVAGFCVAHDVSERCWQMEKNGGQWGVGKTFDTFCPLGNDLVTRESVSDPHKLGLRCLVNGKVMQNSNTDQMIFKTEDLINWASQFFTLTPGDIILSGTPPGVGVFRKPPVYLSPGDVITCEIDELGQVTNQVVKEEDLFPAGKL
eukprot:c8199_g1_i1.p1 GENE.c8199_g1_i1~~c8199_g1_i1.p1  ORF type:complete len:313 (+),score=76.10 c8199_g1_i1:38-940(+)